MPFLRRIIIVFGTLITFKPSLALGTIRLTIRMYVFVKKTDAKGHHNFKTNNSCHLDIDILKIRYALTEILNSVMLTKNKITIAYL